MSLISVHNRLTWLFESPVGDETRRLLGNIFGALIKRVGFVADSPLEEGVSSEPVSEARNSLLAANLQGISSIRARRRRQRRQKRASNQSLTGQFPKHPNREFFAALQGI